MGSRDPLNAQVTSRYTSTTRTNILECLTASCFFKGSTLISPVHLVAAVLEIAEVLFLVEAVAARRVRASAAVHSRTSKSISRCRPLLVSIRTAHSQGKSQEQRDSNPSFRVPRNSNDPPLSELAPAACAE